MSNLAVWTFDINTQREKKNSSNYKDFHYAQNKIKLNNIHKQKRGHLSSRHSCFIKINLFLSLSLSLYLSYEALTLGHGQSI